MKLKLLVAAACGSCVTCFSPQASWTTPCCTARQTRRARLGATAYAVHHGIAGHAVDARNLHLLDK